MEKNNAKEKTMINEEATVVTEGETMEGTKKSKIKAIGKKVWNKTIDAAKYGVVFIAGVAVGAGANYLYNQYKTEQDEEFVDELAEENIEEEPKEEEVA